MSIDKFIKELELINHLNDSLKNKINMYKVCTFHNKERLKESANIKK